MKKKKWLSMLLVCAIFFGVLQGVVFAETVAPNIVAHYTFDSDTEGWWLYGSGYSTLGRERVAPNSDDYCIAAYGRPDAWTSPAIDIYQLIKAAGPGTYTVHATVKTDSTHGGRTRILLRSDKENSFIKDQGTDYHMWLSVGPKMERNAWKNLSGSFKILPSDISESTGQLVLCFDSLVNQTPSALYISDVIICKLSNTGATNGTFEYGTVGWRNWGGDGTLDVGTQYKFGNLIPIGHYLKASTYGSIACNVDQILSNYGKIKYQVDFDLYLASYSLEAIDKLQFYLSKGEYQYHYLIQQKDQLELVHGWQHISFEIDTSIAPYYSPGSDVLYDLLQPNTREVFFRIQYDPVSGAEEQDEEYGITNFTFRPKTQANYVPSQELNLSNTTLELTPGQSYQLTATLLPSNATYKGIEWKTTNGYYVGVNQYGLVTAHGRPGTSAVITAQSEDGASIARCTVTVKSTDPFDPSNIEYIRIKKYDRSSYDGDSDITTIVTKSSLQSAEYFEVVAPDRANVAFIINDALINELKHQEENYQETPNIALFDNYYFHLAKLGVDRMAQEGIIEAESTEYYGIWASEANRLLIIANRIASQVQVISAAVTAVYAIYNFVSAVKSMQMVMNTTVTYNSADYRGTAYLADDLLGKMTNNPNADTVMLGTNYDGVAYNQVAEAQKRSYFYSANYDNYVNQYGADAMLATNRTFISNAKEAGKTFWFSHDPLTQLSNPALSNTTYTYELRYLEQIYGITLSSSNIIEVNGCWYLKL